MRSFSNRVLKEIDEQKITPKPKWYFLLRGYSILTLLIISMILGTISIGIMIGLLTNYDWDIYPYLNRSPFQNDLMAIPYFWVAVLLVIVWLVYRSFRTMGRGYRHNMYMIIAATLVLNLLGGTIIFASGLGLSIHDLLLSRVPVYQDLVDLPKNEWALPNQGLLGGQILSVRNQNNFTLAGLDGKIWQIRTASATWPEDLKPQTGIYLKLIGQNQGSQIFIVKLIRSWNNIGF